MLVSPHASAWLPEPNAQPSLPAVGDGCQYQKNGPQRAVFVGAKPCCVRGRVGQLGSPSPDWRIAENRAMSDTYSIPAAAPAPAAPPRVPTVGFVSLGCPKALTDSELILTQLRAEGYETSKTFAGADLVIVNTCGFIDDAIKESLDTIGEALAANGRVIVTGCLGAKAGDGPDGGGNLVRQLHPKVLAVTGPHAT